MDLTIVLAILAAFGLALTVSVTFDLNAWLERRAAGSRQCHHYEVGDWVPGEGFVIQPLVVSPPGTIHGICSRCGTWFPQGLEAAGSQVMAQAQRDLDSIVAERGGRRRRRIVVVATMAVVAVVAVIAAVVGLPT